MQVDLFVLVVVLALENLDAAVLDFINQPVFLVDLTAPPASQIPVMFGILTTENIEQAIERAGTKAGNKGYDCALGAIEMVNLIKEIEA